MIGHYINLSSKVSNTLDTVYIYEKLYDILMDSYLFVNLGSYFLKSNLSTANLIFKQAEKNCKRLPTV